MSNLLFTKITGAIAPLLHSRASAPLLHAFPRSPSAPKRLLHNNTYNAIVKELRRHGSDRFWPHSTIDDKFLAIFGRIAGQTSKNLRLPLPLVNDTLFSIIWPRNMPLFTPKNRAYLLEFKGDGTMSLPKKKDEDDCKLGGFKLNMPYTEYIGEWKFRGSLIKALPEDNRYEAFQTMFRDARPEGFTDGLEDIGDLTFAVVWSTDGVEWCSAGHTEGGLEGLYEAFLKHKHKEFTVLFLKNRWVKRAG